MSFTSARPGSGAHIVLTSFRTSASNCAQLYNISLAEPAWRKANPIDWPFVFKIQSWHVWDAFVILSLLEYNQANNLPCLNVPHGGSQRSRFAKAMQERNAHIRALGQQEVTHRCNRCTRYYDNRASGGGICTCSKLCISLIAKLASLTAKTSVVVIDGVTIGHPCCSVHNCQVPLSNQRHHFCPEHAHHAKVCSIKDCSEPVTPESRTCAAIAHKNIEKHFIQQGHARFRLHELLQRSRMAGAANSMPKDVDPTSAAEQLGAEEQDFVVDKNGNVVPEEDSAVNTCPDKPATGNRRLRAQFGRKRTHNEQIIVAPCGVIIARSTFYGAEAVKSIVVSLLLSAHSEVKLIVVTPRTLSS